MRMNRIVVALVVGSAALVSACSSGVNLASDASRATPSSTVSRTPAPPPTTTSVAPTTTTTPPPPPPTTTRPTPTTTKPALTGLASGTPCRAVEAACVDKSTGQAWLISGGRVVYGPVPMMPGKPSEPTPVGFFHVQWKDKHHKSSEFNNAPMENSVFFADGGVAFHEGSLSRPSAGCVHLSYTASERFFDTLAVGDPVEVVA